MSNNMQRYKSSSDFFILEYKKNENRIGRAQ